MRLPSFIGVLLDEVGAEHKENYVSTKPTLKVSKTSRGLSIEKNIVSLFFSETCRGTMQYINYLVYGKYARATEGHLLADDLNEKIRNHDGSEAYYNHFDVIESALKIEINTGKTKFDPKKQREVPVYRYVDNNPSYHLLAGETLEGPTFKNAEGICRPAFGLVGFDFDNEDSPERSLADVRAFLNFFRFEHFYVAYSGSKGFHISIPFAYFGLPADENLPKTLRNLAHELKAQFPTLDTSVYNIGRKFRAPNTLHPKTNLYKTIISHVGVDITSMDAIKEYCKTRHTQLYDKVIPNLDVNAALVAMLERAKTTAEYDKSKAGTALAPTKLEEYDGKVCIKRLLDGNVDEGERNTTALILINDFFKSGKSKEYCESVMGAWITRVMPEHRREECYTMIDDIYSGDRFYNHGCLEPIKSKHCSAKCGLWDKLAPEKRPTPVDAPKRAFKDSQVILAQPATKFIQHWLKDNMAVVTLANNWYLHNDYDTPIPRNIIEDRIFNASDIASRKEFKIVSQNKITAYLNEWEVKQRSLRLEGLRIQLSYTGDNDLVAKWLVAVLSREPNELEVAVTKHWLWLVKRKLNNKSVERELMLIVAGITNTGKTQAVTKLFKPVKELVDTMALDAIADERHDFRLTNNLVVFFDEMAATKNVNVEALKNKITSKWLNYRPLGKTARVQGKNLASFIGSSNSRVQDIIKDPTSARRYYELWVSQICQWDSINEIDYIELWRGINETLETPYISTMVTDLGAAQESFRALDSVEEWLELEELTKEPTAEVAPKDAYTAYMLWLETQKRERYGFTMRKFFNRMNELGLCKRREHGRFYKIRVSSNDSFDPSRR